MFDADELEFLRAVSTHLAEGARRGLLIREATEPDSHEAPGLVVLGDDWSVESVTPGVERWLEELPDGEWKASGTHPRRSSPWPVGLGEPQSTPTHPGRSPSRGCSRSPASGWFSTEPHW
jgi:hypothetical protein